MSLASVKDFIDYVGLNEAVQLSQAGSPEMHSVDSDKVQSGLNQAQDILSQKVSIDWPLFKPCQLRIARYILDPYTSREVVLDGYTQAWSWVESRAKKILWT
jgi:hypothetical protein